MPPRHQGGRILMLFTVRVLWSPALAVGSSFAFPISYLAQQGDGLVPLAGVCRQSLGDLLRCSIPTPPGQWRARRS
jgi:hypothetical protein